MSVAPAKNILQQLQDADASLLSSPPISSSDAVSVFISILKTALHPKSSLVAKKRSLELAVKHLHRVDVSTQDKCVWNVLWKMGVEKKHGVRSYVYSLIVILCQSHPQYLPIIVMRYRELKELADLDADELTGLNTTFRQLVEWRPEDVLLSLFQSLYQQFPSSPQLISLVSHVHNTCKEYQNFLIHNFSLHNCLQTQVHTLMVSQIQLSLHDFLFFFHLLISLPGFSKSPKFASETQRILNKQGKLLVSFEPHNVPNINFFISCLEIANSYSSDGVEVDPFILYFFEQIAPALDQVDPVAKLDLFRVINEIVKQNSPHYRRLQKLQGNDALTPSANSPLSSSRQTSSAPSSDTSTSTDSDSSDDMEEDDLMLMGQPHDQEASAAQQGLHDEESTHVDLSEQIMTPKPLPILPLVTTKKSILLEEREAKSSSAEPTESQAPAHATPDSSLPQSQVQVELQVTAPTPAPAPVIASPTSSRIPTIKATVHKSEPKHEVAQVQAIAASSSDQSAGSHSSPPTTSVVQPVSAISISHTPSPSSHAESTTASVTLAAPVADSEPKAAETPVKSTAPPPSRIPIPASHSYTPPVNPPTAVPVLPASTPTSSEPQVAPASATVTKAPPQSSKPAQSLAPVAENAQPAAINSSSLAPPAPVVELTPAASAKSKSPSPTPNHTDTLRSEFHRDLAELEQRTANQLNERDNIIQLLRQSVADSIQNALRVQLELESTRAQLLDDVARACSEIESEKIKHVDYLRLQTQNAQLSEELNRVRMELNDFKTQHANDLSRLRSVPSSAVSSPAPTPRELQPDANQAPASAPSTADVHEQCKAANFALHQAIIKLHGKVAEANKATDAERAKNQSLLEQLNSTQQQLETVEEEMLSQQLELEYRSNLPLEPVAPAHVSSAAIPAFLTDQPVTPRGYPASSIRPDGTIDVGELIRIISSQEVKIAGLEMQLETYSQALLDDQTEYVDNVSAAPPAHTGAHEYAASPIPPSNYAPAHPHASHYHPPAPAPAPHAHARDPYYNQQSIPVNSVQHSSPKKYNHPNIPPPIYEEQ